MIQIPVYVFTGFLDSGKTKFIQETLEDERFNAGERTLLLVFEEGEEEYDFSTYPHKNVFLEILDQQTVTTKQLQALAKKHRVDRVVAEMNGMQMVGDLYMRFPEDWAVAQEVMFADSTTFMTYNANMRNLVMDKLVGAQMVVFNRLTKGQDTMPFHKIARAASRRIDILYDYTDGTTQFDEIEDPLPFDLDAPVIEIADEDYALWYRDMSEELAKYDGKCIKFKGIIANDPRLAKNSTIIGRHVMTCCADDIAFRPIACESDEEIIAAAKRAHAHSFIRRLPLGYDTIIEEGGGGLSQGQKQLLCITRVMLSKPPMLILDEATSSIDTRTEMKIQDAFSEMTAGRTSFIVAHRLSTVKNADEIIVISKDGIQERGQHEELLNRENGIYANLYQAQFARL